MKPSALANALLAARQEGQRAGAEYLHSPSSSRRGEFGRFSEGCRFAAVLLRRILVTFDVPPHWLVIGRALTHRAERQSAFDAFLRRYAYWQGVRHGLRDREHWKRVQRGPVILMYHALGRCASEHASCYVVPRARFCRQMRWLKWRGYHVLPLRELIAHLQRGTLPPRRSVVITFDDGYADNCDVALPVLRRNGFPATVFVVSDAIGHTATWTSDPALRERAVMSRAQLARIVAGGLDVGAHTRTHPSLTSLSGEEQEAELQGSRQALEQEVGVPVLTFAYPYGDYDSNVGARVGRAGFVGACSNRTGINDPATPPLELRRIEVRGTDSLWSFAMMLWRGHRARPAKHRRQLEHVAE